VRASDALCRAADSRSRAPTPRSRAPCRVALLIRTAPSRDAPTSRPPPRQAHRDRRWFRATNNRRTRAPSIGSTRTLRLGRLGHACCSLAWRRPHPVACRDPVPPRQGPAVRFELSLRSRLLPRTLRERCVSPTSATDFTSRAPRGLLDSRLRISARRLAACYGLAARCARTRGLVLGHGPGGDEVGAPTPLARRANQVELRLTANLQLQPLPQLVTWILLAGLSASFFDQVHQTQRSPGGAAIDSPSAPNLPIRAFSAANRACDEASDVLFCDPGWIQIDRRPRRVHPRDLGQSRDDGGDPQTPGPAGSPSPGAARSASAAASSKDDDVIESGRLPSKRAPSPALCARAHNARITRSLPVTMAFATAIRLQRCFTRGASPEGEPAG
jgi:hypothetical protein